MGIEVNFNGKIAFVTGASSGLGSRFAKILAEAGAQVVLAARRTERLKELRAEIEANAFVLVTLMALSAVRPAPRDEAAA